MARISPCSERAHQAGIISLSPSMATAATTHTFNGLASGDKAATVATTGLNLKLFQPSP